MYLFVQVNVDITFNNIAIIYKKDYVEIILKEIGFIDNPSNTDTVANKCSSEIIDSNATTA